MIGSADLHTLTGAYAVDALLPAEAEAFSRHLGACPACAQEVRELRETATRLGCAVTQVSPALRDQIVRALPEVRQLPPLGPRPAGASLRGGTWQRWLPGVAVAASRAFGESRRPGGQPTAGR
ncbi:hypothetical protein ABZ721_10500 [Streptomyces sp. NPDC006733]|uniref:RskA family anti-sigma factor n=1 Tax=Streptomyces sp. NPDC006733 TaxID=3155460 RepID=UPI0033F8B523